MPTPGLKQAGARWGLVALAGLVLSACTSSSSSALHTPAVSASPSPSAPASVAASPSASPASTPNVTGSYGVLVTPPSAATYTVSLVGVDGKVVASAQASSPAAVSCGTTAAALVPLPVSTSNSRLYFMDAGGGVRTLSPDGTTSSAPIINLPVASGRRSMFAVSPDDSLIAVVVADFTSSGASTSLYVDQLQAGGTQTRIFSETGSSTLWPTGWHGTNNLVVAKVAACTQGGGPFTGSPMELHVVDPGNGNRRFTIGGAGCIPVNRPSPAGVVCENPPNANVLSWTDATVRTYPIQGPIGAYLSPNGSNVAFVDNVGTTFTGGGSAMAGVFTCTWIDDTHVLAGGDTQQQPRVGDTTTGMIIPVAAQGDCGGRIPGGL